MKTIQRPIYLNRLIERRENGAIKIVTGIRRCGKTYLLFDLYDEYLQADGVPEGNIIKIPLDDDANAVFRDPEALRNHIEDILATKKGQCYLFLDEIQYAITEEEFREKAAPPRIYGVLNGLLRKKGLDVYVTGSNSKLLSSDVQTEFRGRGDVVKVHPLSYSEFASAHDGDPGSIWAEYSVYGGMPRVLAHKSDDAKASYLNSLFDEVYLRDIVERYGFRNEEALAALTDVLASGVGSLSNPSKIAKTFKSHGSKAIDDKTVREYIDALKEAFLVSEVKRYDVKGRKHIGSPFKYYYEDLGLRNARLNFRQQEENHLMENAIYNELVVRGYNMDVGIVPVRHAGSDGKIERASYEIDFVCNLASRRYYIQSAFSIPDAEKRQQEERPLLKSGDSFRKVIVVKDAVRPWFDEEGVLTIGLHEFLSNPEALNA